MDENKEQENHDAFLPKPEQDVVSSIDDSALSDETKDLGI